MSRSVVAIIAAGILLFTAVPVAAAPAGIEPPEEPAECDPDFVQKTSRIWTVLPNGSDDTANIECAIAEVSAHGGLTVRLAPGTFFVDFLFADGFNGAIRGAGRDATTIEPLDGGLDCQALFDQIGVVVWMAFTNSHLTMTDLGLNIPDVACVEPYDGFVDVDPETGDEFGFSAQDFNAMVVVATRGPEPTDACGIAGHGGLTAKRLRVDAPQPDFSAPIFNPQGAFSAFFAVGTTPFGCEVPDQLIGDVLVRNVYAEGVGNLIQAQSVVDSRIKVFNNHTVGVDASVILSGNEGTVGVIHDNLIEAAIGVGIVSDNCGGPGPGFCVSGSGKVNIFRNEVHMSPIGFAGILAVSPGFAPPVVDTKIFANHISGDGNVAGVFLEGVDGDRVTRNTFVGASVFAVLAEGATTNSKILSNDMTDHTAFEAGILLGPLTSLNTVKRNAGATVVDLGTDNMVEADVATLGLSALTSAEITTKAQPTINRFESPDRYTSNWFTR